MRIQFEINADLWERIKRYAPSEKMRHETAKLALEEWLTRREGRDKKLQLERITADAELLKPIIQKLIDDEEIIVK